MLLPVGAVERLNLEVPRLDGIEASRIHAIAIGMGSRDVEGLHTTVRAEEMLCGPGIEAIHAEGFLPGQESEATLWNDQVEKADAAADRAVALVYFEMFGSIDLESYPTAVTPTRARDQIHLISRLRLRGSAYCAQASAKSSAIA
jgi:hypothetical protein